MACGKAFQRFALAAAMACAVVAALSGNALSAGATVVIDAGSGRVLSHENAFQRWYPASLTKIMTAYVAFRAIKAGEVTLNSPVRMSKNAAGEPPSKMGYKPGSTMTLDNALKMLLVKSANDVAVAIAESLAGSEAGFARRMNGEARRIGMTGSNFVNPNGLYDRRQYSTARDLALLSATVRREFPQYAHYFKIEGIKAGDKLLRSYNILLGRFEGADGMKTGFICSSGFNLIGSATRGGRTLIAVVLGAESQQQRAEEAAELLARGFDKRRSAGTRVGDLAPYGASRDKAPDMRSTICTKGAQAERWDARDSKGRMIIRTRYLKPMSREPVVVAVGLGGASGPAPEIRANVPIPTPRPDDAPQALALTPPIEPEIEIRMGIPLPTPRPGIVQ
ncbi:MAG: D-alanyl-D-alanine carboxypeptidase family protein [Rhizobiaceae bacterium]